MENDGEFPEIYIACDPPPTPLHATTIYLQP